jgi:hypothetical protein
MNQFKFWTGILFFILNLLIWINGMLLHRNERGLDTIYTLPLMIAGAFLLLGWFRRSGPKPTTKSQEWKFVLNAFLINYALCYLIYMISDLLFSASIDLLSVPGIILPALLSVFVMGFILAWNHEFYAGFFFILWYALVLFGSFRYYEIMNRGPHMHFGIVILIHGVLYLVYYFRIREKG